MVEAKNDMECIQMDLAADAPILVYTDGSCIGNPGPGGWAAIMEYGGHEKVITGGEPSTTNNRMELMAIIMALESLKEACAVEVHADSKYVLDGIDKWIAGWKRKGWKTASGDPVKNKDLWQRLEAAKERHDVRWRKVKGHSGDPLNERCDQLARNEAVRMGS